MAEGQDDDPFDWEIDRVVQELCSPDRSWLPAPRAHFPDPDQLARCIRDADYNGEVLLLSLDDEADLWSDFNIKATKFKQTIRSAIRQLRLRSRKFKEREEVIRDGTAVASKTNKPSVPTPDFPEALTSQSAKGHEKLSSDLQNDIRSSEHSDTGEPPKKKPRRLGKLDMVATERPANSAILRTIPTEADTVTLPEENRRSTQIGEVSANVVRHTESYLEKLFSRPGAYWGEGKLSRDDVLTLDEEATEDSEDFSWSRPWLLGSGRKAYVNGLTKRYFRTYLHSGASEDGDTLPLYGEAAADYFDPDQDAIDREIEEEEEEIRREKERLQRSILTPDAIDACLTRMLDEHTTKWRESKLPGLQHKAYGLWLQARRKGNRQSLVIEFSKALTSLQTRLDAVLNSLKDNVYSKESELRRMGPILEPPVYEIAKTKWSINVLASPTAPAKVSLPKKTDPAPKKAKFEQQDDGFDIWSEEEADGLDDFIDDDKVVSSNPEDFRIHADKTTESQHKEVRSTATVTSDAGPSFTPTSDDVVIHDLTGSANNLVEVDISAEPKRTLENISLSEHIRVEELQDIVNMGTEHWEQLRDGPRLVLTMIHNWSTKRKDRIFRPINSSDNSDQVWEESIEAAMNLKSEASADTPSDSRSKNRLETAIRLSALFDIYTGSKLTTAKFKKLDQETVERIRQKKCEFDRFWCLLREVSSWFLEKSEESEIEADLENSILTPAQRKKNRHASAKKIQKHDTQQTQAQQARRDLLRKKLENSNVSGEQRRLIINESKLEGQGLVYVHDHIAPRIKDHQIDGVRFMWDQITRGTGCLLAHTMGLGKTMQVITLLTAIVDAAKSEDESISGQIPEQLRNLTTLILCPPGILNNWIDELLVWAPEGFLGRIFSIHASTPYHERQGVAEDWAASGGVLVLGYNMLSGLEGKSDKLLNLILDSPSLVVGDEAHYLKNSTSKRGRIATLFRTKCRIALTGSPLANKVDEYFSMIDWVAPGFLGKKEDFSSSYAIPIKEGLWKESFPEQRRMARILLVALKKKVANKVHRRTVGVLKDNLPPKTEYILYLDLVEIQKKAYQAYMKGILDSSGNDITQTTVFAMTATLRELLAHPSVLRRKLHDKQEKRMISRPMQSDRQEQSPDSKEPAGVLGNVLEVLESGRCFFETISASYKMLVLDKILEEAMRLGENVLIFSHSLLTLNYVESNLCRNKQRACRRLDGDTPVATRQAIVKSFNSNKSQAFLISTTAGGIGLNIYGANRVVILDFMYNPVEEQQAIGRAYRIGQTKKVVVYWLMCDGTFEKNLHQHQVFKIQLASRVVDEKHPMPKADRQLLDWVKECRDVPHKDKSIHQGKDPILDALLASEAICSGISSIDTTETFEEEEEDKALSAKDQIEADRLAAEQGLAGKVTLAANATSQPIFSGQQIPEQVRRLPPIYASNSASSVIFGGEKSASAAANGSSTQIPSGQPPYNVLSGMSRSTPTPLPILPSSAQQWPQPTDAQVLPSSQPHTVASGYWSSPREAWTLLSNAAPTRPFPAQPIHQGQIADMINAGYLQSQQQPPTLPAGPIGLWQQSNDTAVSIGVSGTVDEQRIYTVTTQDATQPIMVDARQRTSTMAPRTKEPARDGLKTKLVEIYPSATGKVDQILRELDSLLGGLQKQKMFTDLLDIVSHDPAIAAALVDGRISAQTLAQAGSITKDKFKELLLRKTRERDPDHASQIRQRSSRLSEPANEQKARDLMAQQEVLKRRQQQKTTNKVKAEGQRSSQSTPTQTPPPATTQVKKVGGTKSNPFIVDDD